MKHVIKLFIYFSLIAISSCQSSLEEKLKAVAQERDVFLKKLEKVENDSLRDEIERMGKMLFWMKETSLHQNEQPLHTSYSSNPLAILGNYSTTELLVENFYKGILIRQDNFYEKKDRLKILSPFPLPLHYNIKFDSVIFDNKLMLPILAEVDTDLLNKGVKSIVAASSSNMLSNDIEVYYPEIDRMERKTQPSALTGTFTGKIPSNIHEVKFSKEEVGKTKTVGAFNVTLEKAKGHYAQIIVTAPEGYVNEMTDGDIEWVKATATDHTDRNLEPNGWSTRPDDFPDFYISFLNRAVNKDFKKSSFEQEILELGDDYKKSTRISFISPLIL